MKLGKPRNKKKTNTTTPEQLKVGDNVLVRDHTSKAFQPKYKDFCIVGLLGKNQIEIKDNHRHTTKVHRRDVKKIPVTEKICQLYEEEQVGKVRSGRKTILDNKMQDLGWDATEEIETLGKEDRPMHIPEKTQEIGENETTVHVFPETIVKIMVLIMTFWQTMMSCIQKVPEIWRKTVQAVSEVTRTTGCNILPSPHRILNGKQYHTENWISKQKPELGI